jgi:hypothetical protein
MIKSRSIKDAKKMQIKNIKIMQKRCKKMQKDAKNI